MGEEWGEDFEACFGGDFGLDKYEGGIFVASWVEEAAGLGVEATILECGKDAVGFFGVIAKDKIALGVEEAFDLSAERF